MKRVITRAAIPIVLGLVLTFSASAQITGVTATESPASVGGWASGNLTDGVFGSDNWLGSGQYRAWNDTYGPSDSGVAQPRLTFDLGGSYNLAAVTVHYMVDYWPGTLQNFHAPDSVTAAFSTTGIGGPFGGSLLLTGFDNSEFNGAGTGVGEARFATFDLGGVTASAVQLDFLTDAEWIGLSEITFTAVPEPSTSALLGSGILAMLALRRRRIR